MWEKWGKVAKSREKWRKVARCGYMWLKVALCGEKWFYVVQSMYYINDIHEHFMIS